MQLRFMFFSYLCARVQPGFGEQYTVAFTVSIYVETDRICFFSAPKVANMVGYFRFFSAKHDTFGKNDRSTSVKCNRST